MDTTQIRFCFLDVLKGGRAAQLADVVDMMPSRAVQRGFVPAVPEPSRATLEPGDEEKVREIFWAFIIQGILIPGLNSLNPSHRPGANYSRVVEVDPVTGKIE